jgi:HYR domain
LFFPRRGDRLERTEGRLAMRNVALRCLVVSAAFVLVPLGSAASSSTLKIKATFASEGNGLTPCPAGTPVTTECYAQSSKTVVRGLGTATLRLMMFVDRSEAACEHWRIEGTLGAGTEGGASFTGTNEGCPANHSGTARVDYTFVSGSGSFSGASGTGTIDFSLVQTPSGENVHMSWNGELAVPGYTFDTTPPTFRGIRNKLVKAPKRATRARVRYSVAANDAVDGSVRTRCSPASGAWFRVGRTTVKCAAIDKHANPASATFRVTVRPNH